MGNFWNESSTAVKVAIVAIIVAVIALLIALIVNLGGGSGSQVEATPTGAVDVVDPAGTPTAIPSAEVPTPAPDVPTLTATDNLNVRNGPGTGYLKIGLLLQGQEAEITGISPDGTWWVINFPAAADGQGWVSGDFVTTTGTENVPVVQPPPLPVPTVAPPLQITDWKGEYFNNSNLEGPPALVRNDPSINFTWGLQTPAPEITSAAFSARWTINQNLAAGTYRLSAWVSDGIRIYVDDVLVMDQWQQGPPRNFVVDVNVAAGAHAVRVEYFQATGTALVQLDVGYIQNFPDWKAEYFNNPDVAGAPVVVRNEKDINYNWGPNPPVPGLPANNYSIRWSRNANFEQAQYLFEVTVTGGARLWLDGVLLVDNWNDNPAGTVLQAETNELSAGGHDLRVDYVKRTGNGAITVRWNKLQASGPPVAVINGPTQGKVGEQVNFSANGSSVSQGSSLKSVTWDFGDGSGAQGVSVNHIYNAPGKYMVKMVVVDSNDLSDDASLEINVEQAAQPPVAVINSADAGTVGVPILFDASASTAQGKIVDYVWNFGDGTTANAVQIEKAYEAPGTYNLDMTVTDEAGLSNTATKQIVIAPGQGPAPTATIVPEAPTATLVPEAPTATLVPEAPTNTPEPALPTETPTPEAGAGELQLLGKNWGLATYVVGGAPVNVIAETSVQLVFNADGTYDGLAGCNNYNATYTATTDTVTMTSPVATQQACAEPAGVMEQEAAYLALLPTAATYVVNGNQLVISDAGGVAILTFNAQ